MTGRMYILGLAILSSLALCSADVFAEECFESRVGYTTVEKTGEGDAVNVKCSQKTGGILWWGDPFDGTVPMGEMPEKPEADYLTEEAVVRLRTPKLTYYPCNNCHGTMVPVPKDSNPRLINMHQDIVENSLELKHGRGAIWCLDCHNSIDRNSLVSHRKEKISFDQPQKLCGKCHGEAYRDWKDGIHGKRIGMWTKGGKKRWWVCTECHNPHDVQPGFKPLAPDPAPALPKGMKNADHERTPHR